MSGIRKITVAAFVALMAAAPQADRAEAARYRSAALTQCYADCRTAYPHPWQRLELSACYAGCLIGYYS